LGTVKKEKSLCLYGLREEKSQQNISSTWSKGRIVKELKDENDQMLTNFKEVNKRIEDHFSKILSSIIVENENDQRVNFNQFAKDVVIPRLTNEEQIEMENDLTMPGEINKVIKLFQKNKTPRDDGFSIEFYEAFLDLLERNLLDCYNETNFQFHKEKKSFRSYRKVKKT